MAPFRSARVYAGVGVIALSAVIMTACSDSSLAPTPRRLAPQGPNLVVINTALPGVVVPGADAGAFTNATVPTEATRVSGAFWDNISSDDTPWPSDAHAKCNVGFYVVGTIGATCLEQTAGSLANAGGFDGGNYWGDNGTGAAAGRDPSSFMFSGTYQYDVTLKGSYAGGTSEVGWFTHDGAGYHFNPVAGWGSKTIGTTVHIPGGANWGLYVKNTALDATGSCAPQTACSDATGGFAAGPFQQFAMFISSDGAKLEVGIEDNGLIPLWNGPDAGNPTNKDSDYQDYILSVTPAVIPAPEICDFITFGRLVTTDASGNKVVISGNAGGNAPGGGILGEIEISIGNTQYHVHTVDTYGPTTSGVLFPDEFARVITGKSGNHSIELRLRDDPNPGQGEPGTLEGDMVYLKIDGVVILGPKTLDQGNIQLHLNCRGPNE